MQWVKSTMFWSLRATVSGAAAVPPDVCPGRLATDGPPEPVEQAVTPAAASAAASAALLAAYLAGHRMDRIRLLGICAWVSM
jgi:hypothetical protein